MRLFKIWYNVFFYLIIYSIFSISSEVFIFHICSKSFDLHFLFNTTYCRILAPNDSCHRKRFKHFIFTFTSLLFCSLFTSEIQTQLKDQPGFIYSFKINKNVFITAASQIRQISRMVEEWSSRLTQCFKLQGIRLFFHINS